jgi:hypothetical protein
LGLLVGAVALQMVYRFKFRLQQWILAFGGVLMACLHVRFVLLFSPFFAPILAAMFSRWIDRYRPEKDKFVLNGVLMTLVAVAIAWYFPSLSELTQDVEKQFPSRAVSFLKRYPVQEPLFNTYNYGGYLVASLPEHKVFIDGREDLYEWEGVMSDYVQVTLLKPAALPVLGFYRIRTCLLERGEPLSFVLAELPGWRQIYQDNITVIFERADAADKVVASTTPTPSARREYELPAD